MPLIIRYYIPRDTWHFPEPALIHPSQYQDGARGHLETRGLRTVSLSATSPAHRRDRSLTEFRMDEHPTLEDVDRPFFRPPDKALPIQALVRAAEIGQRDGLLLAPSHRQQRVSPWHMMPCRRLSRQCTVQYANQHCPVHPVKRMKTRHSYSCACGSWCAARRCDWGSSARGTCVDRDVSGEVLVSRICAWFLGETDSVRYSEAGGKP